MSVDSGRKRILIVGDWVIDDDWFVGEQKSPTSTEPRNEHFRSLVPRDDSRLGLCGAGRVTRPLVRGFESLEGVEAIGVGFWSRQDTDIMRCLLAVGSQHSLGVSPYQLNSDTKAQVKEKLEDEEIKANFDRVNLFNLAEALGEEKEEMEYLRELCGEHETMFSTARIIRIFQKNPEGRLDLVERFDWDRPLPKIKTKTGYRAWPMNDIKDKVIEFLKEAIKEFKEGSNQLDGVIVKCLARGMMSDEYVQILLEVLRDLNHADDNRPLDWYVSSKMSSPTWLKRIIEDSSARLRLYLVPEVPLRNSPDVHSWVTEGTHLVPASDRKCWMRDERSALSREAFSHVKDLATEIGLEKEQDSALVILPGKMQAIAVANVGKGKLAGCRFTKDLPKMDGAIGTASIFFAQACSLLVGTEGYLRSDSALNKLVNECVKATLDWREEERKRILFGLGIGDDRSSGKASDDVAGAEDIDWEACKRRWKQALEGIGTISTEHDGIEPRERIELWRANSQIKGFLAIGKKKRDVIARLVSAANEFCSQQSESSGRQRSGQPPGVRSRSCLLIAPPGAGKTLLAKKLASAVGMKLLSFNITELFDRSELVGCFDQILTEQARNREDKLLVFFDEINAQVKGKYVLDRFLMPLEDSRFSRSGRRFLLRSCFWLFADSLDPREMPSKPPKTDDFCSRLTEGVLDMGEDKALINGSAWNELALERVYVGIALLKSLFPHLKRIDKKLVQLFAHLGPQGTVRELRHMIHQLRPDQSGEDVSLGNLRHLLSTPAVGSERDQEILDRVSSWRDSGTEPEWIEVG